MNRVCGMTSLSQRRNVARLLTSPQVLPSAFGVQLKVPSNGDENEAICEEARITDEANGGRVSRLLVREMTASFDGV